MTGSDIEWVIIAWASSCRFEFAEGRKVGPGNDCWLFIGQLECGVR
jgi:hypothetical protein